MKSDNEISLCIDAKAIVDNKIHHKALEITIDILHVAWWPTKQAFALNLKNITKELVENFPSGNYNEQQVKRHIKDIKSLLISLPNGKWLPNPTYFRVDDEKEVE